MHISLPLSLSRYIYNINLTNISIYTYYSYISLLQAPLGHGHPQPASQDLWGAKAMKAVVETGPDIKDSAQGQLGN